MCDNQGLGTGPITPKMPLNLSRRPRPRGWILITAFSSDFLFAAVSCGAWAEIREIQGQIIQLTRRIETRITTLIDYTGQKK